MGVTMRLFPYDEDNALTRYNKGCCTPQDVEDARRVCQIIGAPHYLMNFEREFQQFVIDYFCDEYARGRTPHPCLACNDKIKFSFLFQRAIALDADFIATGHYARVHEQDGAYRLLKGIHQAKDQSYVLFTLRQEELRRTLLPVGWYTKPQIRDFALNAGLPVADKPRQPRRYASSRTAITVPLSMSELPPLPARLWTRRATSLAGTTVCRTLPLASAGAWESPRASPCSYSA